MRNLFLILLAIVLLSSCGITKRRYMPGYSFDWEHKNPKTFANNTPSHVQQVLTHNQLEKIAAKELHKLPNTSEKETVPAKAGTLNALHLAKEVSNPDIPVAKEPLVYTHTVLPADTNNPKFFTGDEQGDDHARRSITFGILSLAIPALAYIILFVIAISSGGTFTNPLTYAIIIFLLGILAGLVFSVLAYIQGIMALKEINATPDIYTGKGQAIWGMIMASILPILMVIYLIIKH